MAFVEIKGEVPERNPEESEWTLHFQKVVYHYDGKESEEGFRFIWRRSDGSLQAARGQARIPDAITLFNLIGQAVDAGLLKWKEDKK